MVWTVYLRRGVAFVPTEARTTAGFYLAIDPVRVVPGSDTAALAVAIEDAMGRGNPQVPTPVRGKYLPPVVLKHAKVSSWSRFEKGCFNWSIVENDGQFEIRPWKKRIDRGWDEDLAKIERLPVGTTREQAAKKLAGMVSERDRLERTI